MTISLPRSALAVLVLAVVGLAGFFAGTQAVYKVEIVRAETSTAKGSPSITSAGSSTAPEYSNQMQSCEGKAVFVWSSYKTGTVDQLVAATDTVVKTTVLSVGPDLFNTPTGQAPLPPYDIDDSSWDIDALVELGVDQVYKGNEDLTRVVLSQRGGTGPSASGGISMVVAGTTRFNAGDTVMLFLSEPSSGFFTDQPPAWVLRAAALRDSLNALGETAEVKLVFSGYVYDYATGRATSAEDDDTMTIGDLEAAVIQATQ